MAIDATNEYCYLKEQGNDIMKLFVTRIRTCFESNYLKQAMQIDFTK